MLPISRSHCRWSKPIPNLVHQHLASLRPLQYPLRNYTTSQARQQEPLKLKSYTSSTSTSTTQIEPPSLPSPRSESSLIPKPEPTTQPIVPLQGVIDNSPFFPINPPSTTRPPPLSLPETDPTLPLYKQYFRLGKAYVIFYKTGLKAIWRNYKAERALGYSNAQPARIYAAVREGKLMRADFQLLLRSRRDLTRLPLFILMWAVCGEFTPLVVVFMTGFVPRTIWIPKQVEAARKEVEGRRKKVLERNSGKGGLGTPIQVIDAMQPESRNQTYGFMAQAYGLYPEWWDRYIPSLIPGWVVQRRVKRRVAEIVVDDFAIARDGGVGRMDGEEVVRACEERGIDVLEKGEGDLREDLEKHLQSRKMSNDADEEKGKVED